MTHAELVDVARRYLLRRHSVVTTECGSIDENPDAIGWRGGISTLIECKASIGDYYADGSKHFRREPEFGCGDYRYYLTPKGLIKGKLRDGWGLLETTGRHVSVVKKAELFPVVNKRHELRLMASAMRRIGQTCPPGVSVKAYYIHTADRASLSIDLEIEEAATDE